MSAAVQHRRPVPTVLPTGFVCDGCGGGAEPMRPALRCTRARDGDDVDHVLHRHLDAHRLTFPTGRAENPFVRYRTLLHAYHQARAAGRSDAQVVQAIEQLDAAVARVDGQGFRITPLARHPRLAEPLGIRPPATILVKDETGNVSGSHKGRHLFGTMLGLLLADDRDPRHRPPLAIASCGNAALAAAVVARAAEWPLEVFVPPDADPSVVHRLGDLGATIVTCARDTDQGGDPTYLRMRQAVAAGAIPFTCQGNENGLAIEGGLTLGYELAEQLRDLELRPDRLFVQVGGGALASSLAQGLEEARQLGVIDRLPRLHAVQTEAVAPLARAHRLMVEELRDPTIATTSDIDEVLRRAGKHRSGYMWPWEHPEGSAAHGILDDETYDWLAVVRAMLLTRGGPIVVDEATIANANALARTTTSIDVDPTGSAGLAGLIRLHRDGDLSPAETSLVLFTGIRRTGDPR